MTEYSSMDLITEQTSNQGTAVPNGMNFGDFQTDIAKNFNPGISSGNAYPWLYTFMPPTAEDEAVLISNYQLPASSSGYIPLSSFNFTAPYVTLIGTGNNKRVSLKTAVNLLFYSASDSVNITFTASGEDQYKQQMVAQTPTLTSSASPVSCRIIKDYSSIFYQNNTNSSVLITIKLGSNYELRYFDLIENSILFASAGVPLYTAPTSNSKLVWDFDFTPVATNPLIPLTVTDTLCRPIIDFTDSVNGNLIMGRTIMVTQNVWGMGNFPNNPAYPFNNYAEDLTNNVRTVIGAEQAINGWTGWQG